MNRGDNNLPHRDRTARGVLVPPARHVTPAKSTPTATVPTPKPASPSSPKNLARVREDLGFDDIPITSNQDQGLREVLGTWINQAFHFKHPDNKAGRAYRFVREKKYQSWKEDLKWALQADTLDDSDKRQISPPKQQLPVASQATQQPATKQLQPVASAAGAKSIEININFGSMPKLSPLTKVPIIGNAITKIRSFQWTKRRVIIATAVTVVIAGAFAWRSIPGLPGASQSAPSTIASTKIDQKPEYGTVLPDGKSIETLGGWHRVSPPGREAVFAYADKINGVTVNISQQPVPEGFKPDVDKSVAELAKSYVATHKITSESQTIYVGTSAQGPQSVILVKDDLLILMKSTQKIDDKAWAAYVDSLK